MYLGLIVETAPTSQLWQTPLHPYTRALIEAIPHPDGSGKLPEALTGEIPDPAHPPVGCRFHPRCPVAFDRCRVEAPPLVEVATEREVACWLYAPAPAGALSARASPVETVA
jgi:peptide/nickel transport system ATP-binding protein